MIRIFGIRHHGPGSARSLQMALKAYQPDCIAVEAPADAQNAFPFVKLPGLVPPVAMLIYNPTDFNQAVYLPFAEFSPEWQAIRFGLQKGIAVEAMDLPMSLQFTLDRQQMQKRQFSLQLDPNIDPELARMQLDPLGYMAGLAGYEDSERWWEVTFEQRESDMAIFDAILEMMMALRDDLAREETPQTLLREAHMRKTLRQLQKKGHQRIAVVCGAWHAPALQRLDQIKQSIDNTRLKGLKKTKTRVTWIPWSYERLALQSGYGAGVIAPAWYQLLYHHREEVATRWLSEAARLFREEALDISSAHVVDAVRLANTLAIMRARQVAGIHELQEASQAVFFQGDKRPLDLIEKKLVFGDIFGKVPSNVPGIPLQKDLEKQVKSARLGSVYQKIGDSEKTLDLRKPTQLLASQLLHRLNLLGIPWGELQDARETQLGNFQEHWNLNWLPEFAIHIIEAGMWGNTVREACLGFIGHELGSVQNIVELTALMEATFKADLPEAIEPLVNQLQALSASTRDVFQLMEALPALVRTLRYGDVRQTNTQPIAAIVDEMIPRICIGLLPACMNVEEEIAREIYSLLLRTNRAIGALNQPAYKKRWHKTLFFIAREEKVHPLLQGSCTRLLINKDILSPQQSARFLQLALSTSRFSYLNAASWVEGFLHGSGLLILHQPQLWQLLNQWVASIPDAEFMEVLPLLRRTFAKFAPPERQKLLNLSRQNPSDLTQTIEMDAGYDTERVNIILPTLQKMLGLPDQN